MFDIKINIEPRQLWIPNNKIYSLIYIFANILVEWATLPKYLLHSVYCVRVSSHIHNKELAVEHEDFVSSSVLSV